ncbi:Aldehyde dehydrogenase [Paramyrothecium foliicola]|nr:Aldehyde dehydrogenase [Paramyrothecium foliicola]
MPPLSTAQEILRETGHANVLIRLMRNADARGSGSSVYEQLPVAADVQGPNAHPISIARNLLLIALSLQIREEVTPSGSEDKGVSTSNMTPSNRYFDAVIRYVTSKDQLVTLPEGVEALMLEGLYQLVAGNLQLGWLAFRRATGIAKLLDVAFASQERPALGGDSTKTRTASTFSFLWYRLDQGDRILSLILGLPLVNPDDDFASPELLAGEVPVYIDSKSRKYLTVSNPKDGSIVSDKVSLADVNDIDDAVRAAEAAFPTWRKTPPNIGRDMLLNLATLVLRHSEALSAMSIITLGNPVSSIGAMEVVFAVEILRYFAGWTDKLAGETYPEEDGFFKFVRQEPLGVTAGIIPWNAPIGSVCGKAAPALAIGNCIILKLSEKTPFSGLAMGTLIRAARIPPGVFQILSGDGSTGALI